MRDLLGDFRDTQALNLANTGDQPITYRLDGKQYIALMGGVGAAAPGGNAGPGNQATPFSPKLVTFTLDGTLNLTSQGAQ